MTRTFASKNMGQNRFANTLPQFIVMFRSRFNDAFPKSLPHFGPQELERDVVTTVPGDRVEHFLCALLGLLLNRKQDVKYDFPL